MTDRNDFPMNGSNSQTLVKSLVGPAVGDGESLRRPSVAHGEPALRAYIERQDRNKYINLASQIGYNGSYSYIDFETKFGGFCTRVLLMNVGSKFCEPRALVSLGKWSICFLRQ